MIAVLVGAGMIAALTGCVGKNAAEPTAAGITVSGERYDGPPVTLEFWNPWTGPDGAYFKNMVEKFNDANPNIDVKVTTLAYADFYEKLPTAVRSNRGPDVAAVHLSELANVAAQNAIVPIDNIVDALGFEESDFAPTVWKGGIYQGKRYGIPLDVSSLGLYYNKTLLAKAGLDPKNPPKTGTEYLAALEALKRIGVQGQWIDPYPFTGNAFVSLLAQFGGSLYNDKGTEATWDSEAGVKALTWLRDLIDKGYSPKNVNADAWWTAFKQGKTAFAWMGIWGAADPDLDKVDWGVATLPVIGDKAATWADSHQFVATTQTAKDPNKQAAAAYFIAQMSNDSLVWAAAPAVPARASVRETSEFKAMWPQTVFADQIDDVVMRPTLPGLTEPQALLNEAINKALTGKESPADALHSTAERATQILKENQKKYGY